jgi:hypothetical protein
VSKRPGNQAFYLLSSACLKAYSRNRYQIISPLTWDATWDFRFRKSDLGGASGNQKWQNHSLLLKALIH